MRRMIKTSKEELLRRSFFEGASSKESFFEASKEEASDLFENGNHHCHGAGNSIFDYVHHRRR